MQVTIVPGRAQGNIAAPPSKSMAHRLLICAALSDGKSTMRGISSCADVLATLDCLRALGVEYDRAGDTVTVYGRDFRKAAPTSSLLCRESGSTLRFMIPLALLSGNPVTLHGAPYLMQRPMGVYVDICKEKNLFLQQSGQDITVKGPLPAGEYHVVGNVSSQFISGLLFALPLTDGNSVIHITPPIESRSYLDLTVDALRTFGITVMWIDSHTISILENQRYLAQDVSVEGDYSNAAFLEAFNLFGGEVTVEGLRSDSLQGDRVYRDCFAKLNRGKAEISIENCPDLGPILFAIAAAKHGGIFRGTRRLRMKESDRAAVMAEELQKFGARVTVYDDTVEIDRVEFHAPAVAIDGHNDHRIVMSMAVLLSLTGGILHGAEAVAKSFPDFFDRLRQLGLEICEK